MDRERIIQFFFFGFLAVVAYEIYLILEPFFTPILWAILLAFITHPVIVWLDRIVRRRTLSALILTISVAVPVILLAVALSDQLFTEAQLLYARVVAGGGVAGLRDWAVHSDAVAMINRYLSPRGIRIEDAVPQYGVQAAKATSQYVMHNLTTAAHSVASAVVDFGLILLIYFYLLRDGESYYEEVRKLTPLHEDDKKVIFDTLRSTLTSVMRGLMLTAALQGLTIGLGMAVLGVPYWAFLSIITGVAGLTPFGGTALVWIPAAIYLYAIGNIWSAAILVGWSAVCLAIIDNFIKPMAMRHGTGLPTVALFFGVAGGLEAYGPLGLFLGPAIIAVFAAMLRVYMKTYGESRRKAA